MKTQVTPSMPCEEALSLWFHHHRAFITGQTPRTYKQYVETLSKFFEKLPLKQIRIGHIREYQGFRKETCGAERINSEVGLMQMVLREVNVWKHIQPLYRRLPVRKKKVRQNMSEEEEARLLTVALKHPRRRVAGHCLIIMANTSMGFGELRHLRRQDVYLDLETPFVECNEGTKNDYRVRTIPLNALALKSMVWIIRRWEELGGTKPDQYILPHNSRLSPGERGRKGHLRGLPLFYEPMNQIHRAARLILNEAGLSHLDPYDMRSHAITRLLSNPNVSDQVYAEIAGHVGDAMKRRYSKQRMDSKKAALDAMCKDQLQRSALPRLGKPRAAEKPLLEQQTPVLSATPPLRGASSQSFSFAGGFYVTSNTWNR